MTYTEERSIYLWMDQHQNRCRYGRDAEYLFGFADIVDIDDDRQVVTVTCKCTTSKQFNVHVSNFIG